MSGLYAAIARYAEHCVPVVQVMAEAHPIKTAILESFADCLLRLHRDASALVASLLIAKSSMDRALPVSHVVR
jgi:hypothetical protein